jgi:hypothetical protein
VSIYHKQLSTRFHFIFSKCNSEAQHRLTYYSVSLFHLLVAYVLLSIYFFIFLLSFFLSFSRSILYLSFFLPSFLSLISFLSTLLFTTIRAIIRHILFIQIYCIRRGTGLKRRNEGIQPPEAIREPVPFMFTRLNIDTQALLKIHPSTVHLSDDV